MGSHRVGHDLSDASKQKPNCKWPPDIVYSELNLLMPINWLKKAVF